MRDEKSTIFDTSPLASPDAVFLLTTLALSLLYPVTYQFPMLQHEAKV